MPQRRIRELGRELVWRDTGNTWFSAFASTGTDCLTNLQGGSLVQLRTIQSYSKSIDCWASGINGHTECLSKPRSSFGKSPTTGKLQSAMNDSEL